MLDLNQIFVTQEKNTEKSSIISSPYSDQILLRFDTGQLSKDGSTDRYTIDLRDLDGHCIHTVDADSISAVLVLKNIHVEVDISTRKNITTPHGMKGWLVVGANFKGVVVGNPYGPTARDLIVGFDGETHIIENRESAIAFSSWRIVTGDEENELVLCDRSSKASEED